MTRHLRATLPRHPACGRYHAVGAACADGYLVSEARPTDEGVPLPAPTEEGVAPGACQLCGGDRWVGAWSEPGPFSRLCVPCKFVQSGLTSLKLDATSARTAQDVTDALARALGLPR